MEAGVDFAEGNHMHSRVPEMATGDSCKWMMKAALWAAVCAVLVASGTLYGVFTTTAQLRDDLMVLRTQRDQNTAALGALKDRVENDHQAAAGLFEMQKQLSDNVFSALAKGNEGKVASLDIAKSDYVAVDYSRVVASCERVESYLDGYRITFRLGNLTTADFAGGTLHMSFGSKYPKNESDYPTWHQKVRNLDVSFVEHLAPGSWTRIPVIITPVAANDLEYFQLSLTTDRLSLFPASGK
jgi:hypothetical protein